MAKLVCLLLCLALVHTGFALKCYTCTNPQDCEGSSNLKEETCGKSVVSNTKPVCVKKVYEDTKAKVKNIARICGVVTTSATAYNKDNILAPSCNAPIDPDTTRFKVQECVGCDEDLCNGAPIHTGVALMTVPLIYLVTKFVLY